MIRRRSAESAPCRVTATGFLSPVREAYSARMPSPTGRALVNAQAVIESFSLSADGERLAYAVRQVRGGRYVSHLWSVPWSGGRARRLTSGPVRDVNPAISPDGRLVAFARTRSGRDPGRRTGSCRWTAARRGSSRSSATARARPSGARTASGFCSWPGRRGSVHRRAGSSQAGAARPPHHPDGLPRRRQRAARPPLAPVDVAARSGARPRRLTHGDFDVQEPTWAPDGSWIAFTADMGDDWNVCRAPPSTGWPPSGGPHSVLAELPGDAVERGHLAGRPHGGLPGHRCRRSTEYALTRAWLVGAGGRRDAALPDARAGSVRRQRGVGRPGDGRRSARVPPGWIPRRWS